MEQSANVVSADSTNVFKNHPDKYWSSQYFKFDLTADISGIESRSLHYIYMWNIVFNCFCADKET